MDVQLLNIHVSNSQFSHIFNNYTISDMVGLKNGKCVGTYFPKGP